MDITMRKVMLMNLDSRHHIIIILIIITFSFCCSFFIYLNEILIKLNYKNKINFNCK
jgi:hypothetical protein